MKTIKILGGGCAKCEKLEANTKIAADALAIEYQIEKVKDMNQIMGYGVMTTPALVVDEAVKSFGKVLTTEEIKKFLA